VRIYASKHVAIVPASQN